MALTVLGKAQGGGGGGNGGGDFAPVALQGSQGSQTSSQPTEEAGLATQPLSEEAIRETGSLTTTQR